MRRVIFIVSLTAVIIASAIGLSFFFYQEQQKNHFVTLYGNVDVRQVDISFRVSGQVDHLYFEEGDLVPPNTLMATLDRRPWVDLVRQAVAQAKFSKVALANAEILLQRRKILVESGAVSIEEYQNSEASRDELRARLQQDMANLGVAVTNLQFTKVYCPTEGTILSRVREPGTVVQPTNTVFTLSITSPVWIRAYLSEKQLGLVYPGMEADVYTDTPGAPVYKGHVGFISPVSEFTPKTVETAELRTDLVYRIRIYADNPDKGLRQGMPVTCKLHRK